MLGPETIIALTALLLAGIALMRQNVQERRARNLASELERQDDERFQHLKSTIQELQTQLNAGAGTEHFRLRQLEATVKMLDLRLSEHDALVCALVTEDEARHLWNVAQPSKADYALHSGVEAELRSLVRRGLLRKARDFRIHQLPRKFALGAFFELTSTGELLLALRKHLKESDTQRSDSLPPQARESGIVPSAASEELSVFSPEEAREQTTLR